MERWELLEYTYNELKKYFNQNVNRTLSIYSISNQLYISMNRSRNSVVPSLGYVLEVLRVMIAGSYVTQLPYGCFRIASEIPSFVDWKMVNSFAGDDSNELYVLHKDKGVAVNEMQTPPVVERKVITPKPDVNKIENNDCELGLEEYKNLFKKNAPIAPKCLDKFYKFFYDDSKQVFHLYLLDKFGKKQFKVKEIIGIILEEVGDVTTFEKLELRKYISQRIVVLKNKNAVKMVGDSKRLMRLNIKWD